MIQTQLSLRQPVRTLNQQILTPPTLRESNNISHTLRLTKHRNKSIPAQRYPRMRRTPTPQHLQQVSEILDALGPHLENVTEDEFLHSRTVDTAASTAEFHAVDDNVVVCCYGAFRRGEQEIHVFGGLGRGERVVCGGEAGSAALAWFRVGGWGEQGEVGDPEEMVFVWCRCFDEILGNSCFVEGEAEVAERGGAAGERDIGARLDDEEVAVVEGKGFRAFHDVLMAEGSKALHGL